MRTLIDYLELNYIPDNRSFTVAKSNLTDLTDAST